MQETCLRCDSLTAPYLGARRTAMCRNIKTLFNFDPPATDEEVYASALQFVRKLSGFTRPSKANEAVFEKAVADVAAVAHRLIDSLETQASPRNREVEAEKARARAVLRYGYERRPAAPSKRRAARQSA
jgi:hypothetical protein